MDSRDNGIHVSGVSYYAACDPRASEVPRTENWPEPRRRKVGKGVQMIYPLAVSDQVASHLEEVGAALMYGDPDARADGRAMLRDARRWREAFAQRPYKTVALVNDAGHVVRPDAD